MHLFFYEKANDLQRYNKINKISFLSYNYNDGPNIAIFFSFTMLHTDIYIETVELKTNKYYRWFLQYIF